MAEDLNRSVRIYLNTSDAQKSYNELIQANNRLKKALAELEAQGKKNTQEFKKTSTEQKNLERTMANYEAKIKETSRVLNNLSGATLNELNAVRKSLRTELNKTAQGTDQYKTKLEQLLRVEQQRKLVLDDMSGQLTQQQSLFSRMANGFNKFGAMGASAIAAVTGISMTFRKCAADAAAMDDVYSDVMKTTGMTRDEVLELNQALKSMDTRTSRERLNELAATAGKLGINAKEDILRFVEASNQINVALGEDLGEDAIKQIGKMVGVFQDCTNELQGKNLKEQMLAVGSAINELGASSTASEDYLVQFAGRLGGVARQAGISMDAILGFGSALDQDMQAVEMSATAFSTVLTKMLSDPAKFANAAGLEVQKFSALVRSDANEAMKELLGALKETGNFEVLTPILQEVGLTGTRATGVITAMANSLDKINEAQRIANEAMNEGVSITKEYNTKNNNLQAQLDKAQKSFKDASIALGESLNPILLKSTSATTYLVKGLAQLGPWLSKNKGLVITLATTWTAYALWVSRATIADKAKLITTKALNLTMSMAKPIVLACSVAYNTLTGNTIRANAAQKLLKATMATTPWGAILAAVTAIGVGIYKWATHQSELEIAMQSATEQMIKEKTECNNLFTSAMNAAEGSKERAKYIGIINEKYGDYLPNLLSEKTTNEELANAMAEVNTQLRSKIALQSQEEAIAKIVSDELEDQAEQIQEIRERAIEELRSTELADQFMQDFEAFANQNKDKIKGILAEDRHLVADFFETWNGGMMSGAITNWGFYTDAVKNATEYLRSLKNVAGEIQKVKDKFKQFIVEPPTKIDPKEEICEKCGMIKSQCICNKGKGGTIGSGGEETVKKEIDERLKVIDDAAQKEIDIYRQKYISYEITEKQYSDKSKEILEKALADKLALENLNEKDREELLKQFNENQVKNKQEADRKMIENLKKSHEETIHSVDNLYEEELQILEDKHNEGLIKDEEYEQEKRALSQNYSKAKLKIEETFFAQADLLYKNNVDGSKELVEDFAKNVEDANKNLAESFKNVVKEQKSMYENASNYLSGISSAVDGPANAIIDGFSNAMNIANKAMEDGVMSASDKIQIVGAAIAGAMESVQQASDLIFEMETNNLEIQKNKQLAIVGDNAEEREKVELEYAQKKLDLEKKQANANAGIQTAQLWINTAMGIASAWASSMQLGPIAGPIAAAALTALLLATAGIQQAAIIKQRDAVLSQTLDSSSIGSGGASSASTTQRVAVPQAAEGRYNVIGEDDGVHYNNVSYAGVARTGLVSTPTLVGERGTELIIDANTLRNIQMNAPYVIDAIRANRVVPQRASGKYDTIVATDNSDLTKAVERLNQILDALYTNGVQSIIVLSELQKKMEEYNKLHNKIKR